MARTGVKTKARKALVADEKARKAAQQKTLDSIQNFAAGLGYGTGNVTSATTYGFNPITRIRTLLEWIHRGSWLGGVAVDLVADDMTRAGIEINGEMEPDEIEELDEAAVSLGLWSQINDTVKWSRLYGGCIAVFLIDGQDMKTPLRIETVGKNQFRGLQVVDRWGLEPSLEDLVTEMGPQMGLPKYYTITRDGPALNGKKIHYSRCLRLEGIRLPYWQRMMENMWGISIFERLWDRMIAFDSATQGAAQLVYKAYIRTYKIEGLRELIAAGGPMFQAVLKWVDLMRQTQGNEGITLLDGKDEFEAQTHGAFSGLAEILLQFIQQIAGALQIPLTRLLGQSPAGLNATGESDLRTYYDGIKQQQERHLRLPVTNAYRALAQSIGIKPPKGFSISFKPLWQLTDKEKSEIASANTESIMKVQQVGIVSDQIILRELKQTSKTTGMWTNITEEEINKASDVPTPPIDPLMGGTETVGEPGEKKAPKPAKDAVRPILTDPVDKDGLFVVPTTASAEDEIRWAKRRMDSIRIAQYADSKCGLPATFDKEGAYLCGGRKHGGSSPCNKLEGTECLIRIKPIDNKHFQSCGFWETQNAGDAEGRYSPKGKLEDDRIGFGATKNLEGFGCERCRFGRPLTFKDSEGRSCWCRLKGHTIEEHACCADNEAVEV